MRQLDLVISSPVYGRQQCVSVAGLSQFPFIGDGWRVEDVRCHDLDGQYTEYLIQRCQLVNDVGLPDLLALHTLEQLPYSTLHSLYRAMLHSNDPVPDFWAGLEALDAD